MPIPTHTDCRSIPPQSEKRRLRLHTAQSVCCSHSHPLGLIRKYAKSIGIRIRMQVSGNSKAYLLIVMSS